MADAHQSEEATDEAEDSRVHRCAAAAKPLQAVEGSRVATCGAEGDSALIVGDFCVSVRSFGEDGEDPLLESSGCEGGDKVAVLEAGDGVEEGKGAIDMEMGDFDASVDDSAAQDGEELVRGSSLASGDVVEEEKKPVKMEGEAVEAVADGEDEQKEVTVELKVFDRGDGSEEVVTETVVKVDYNGDESLTGESEAKVDKFEINGEEEMMEMDIKMAETAKDNSFRENEMKDSMFEPEAVGTCDLSGEVKEAMKTDVRAAEATDNSSAREDDDRPADVEFDTAAVPANDNDIVDEGDNDAMEEENDGNNSEDGGVNAVDEESDGNVAEVEDDDHAVEDEGDVNAPEDEGDGNDVEEEGDDNAAKDEEDGNAEEVEGDNNVLEEGATEMEIEETDSVVGPARRRVGRPKKVRAGQQSKAQVSVKSPARKKDEEEVCFICFDGGDLVVCDRR